MQAPTHRWIVKVAVLSVWLCSSISLGPPCTAHAQQADLDVRLGVGAGIGHRDVAVPSRAGLRTLDSAVFPALAVSVDGGGHIGRHLLLGVRLHYQTSVALRALETPAAGSDKDTSLRSHHVEAGLTPGVSLTTGPEAVQLRVFTGWAWRGLRAVTDIALPQYLLHGFVLRPELRVPFASGSAELRIAPELLVISGVSADLRELASTAAGGIAWGAELELSVRLVPGLRIYFDYRESRVRIGSAWGDTLKDNERFATAGLALF